jgi:hypothetical protein
MLDSAAGTLFIRSNLTCLTLEVIIILSVEIRKLRLGKVN